MRLYLQVIGINDGDTLIFTKFYIGTVGSFIENQHCFWHSMLQTYHVNHSSADANIKQSLYINKYVGRKFIYSMLTVTNLEYARCVSGRKSRNV